MSLAATLIQDGARPISMLPSIKCSTCGHEIEIAAMAEHICAGDTCTTYDYDSQKPTSSNPFVLEQAEDNSWRTVPAGKLRSRAPTLSKKLPRLPLSNINAEAANKPYLNPVSPGFESPWTPARSAGSSGKPAVQRSVTNPVPRVYDPRPPSPELSANLDCAFPPFPTAAATGRRPSTPGGRSTPTGSDRAPSRSASRMDQMLSAEPDPSSWEPKSPRTNGGESVLRRLNTLKSGPFAAKRENSTESRGSPSPDTTRRPSAPVIEVSPYGENAQIEPLSFARSLRFDGSVEDDPKRVPPPRPARPDSGDVLSPSFLDRFSDEPGELRIPTTADREDALPSRNHTFPSSRGDAAEEASFPSLSRMRSEPAMNSNYPATATRHPARSSSRSGIRVDYRLDDAPPVPRPVLQHRQQASMHAPSESGSSAASTAYSGSTDGIRPSPGASSASSLETFSPLTNATRKFNHDEEQMRPAGLNARNQQKPGMRAELPKSSSPPRNIVRPSMPDPLLPQTGTTFTSQPLESPMDPAMHNYARSPSISNSASRPTTAIPRSQGLQDLERPYPSPPTQTTHIASPYEILNSPDLQSLQSVSPPPSTSQGFGTSQRPIDTLSRQAPRRRAPTANRPVCRGCNQVIEGKSVKAADGRLTGRWHKACFVCQSCEAPFVTADFYVINDEPYCEHHYHQQNGSLCHGCNRGIEGQYLETTSSTHAGIVDKLYHPTCFTCCQCRSILTDSYFEITGQVYCERHALAAMRAQARIGGGGVLGGRGGGGLYPSDRRNQLLAERRTTRLINPMVA